MNTTAHFWRAGQPMPVPTPRPRPTTARPLPWLLAVAAAAQASLGHAETLDGGTPPEVVITASRQAQASLETPAAIQAVGREALLQAGPLVNLSEVLNRVPGTAVLNRQNYAQDLQLSLRGSGARSAFGIRGARLIVDGIPATMPDGQSQASTISLPSAQRIEVLRGPLAQLYGNAAGGVVQVFSQEGQARPELRLSADAAPDGMRRLGAQALGQQGRLNYLVDHSDFSTDGWRAHSAAQRRHSNARLRWDADAQTRMVLVANHFDQPLGEDPLGLTRAQFEANPQQAVANATLYNAGKQVQQSQAGVLVSHRPSATQELSLRLYGGTRELGNRLSVPTSAQAPATHAGGIVELDRQYNGFGLRFSQRQALPTGTLNWSLGLDHERLREARRGYLNNGGVQGALKRDEDDRVTSTGLYGQADWAINQAWSALLGLRANTVRFSVRDHFITTGNPDDSGGAAFDATNPVLGLTHHLSAHTHLYANVGLGFETPTFTEIAYSATGSGPNLGLRAARSRHSELGLKTRLAPGQRLELALFHIDTSDEIVVASNSGGRAIYTNATRTRRAGLELAYSLQWSPEWRVQLAWTALQAVFAEASRSASGATVAAGNHLPGVADHSLFSELAWAPRAWPGLEAGLELSHRGRLLVDDLNSDRAAAATLLNLRLGWTQPLTAGWTLRSQLRLDNLADRATVGSVIANDGNGRFFEPAPGRQWALSLAASHRF